MHFEMLHYYDNDDNRLLPVHCVKCQRKRQITLSKDAARSSGKLAAYPLEITQPISIFLSTGVFYSY
jgi:hypothetical protein